LYNETSLAIRRNLTPHSPMIAEGLRPRQNKTTGLISPHQLERDLWTCQDIPFLGWTSLNTCHCEPPLLFFGGEAISSYNGGLPRRRSHNLVSFSTILLRSALESFSPCQSIPLQNWNMLTKAKFSKSFFSSCTITYCLQRKLLLKFFCCKSL
jgi:hypothetical protein